MGRGRAGTTWTSPAGSGSPRSGTATRRGGGRSTIRWTGWTWSATCSPPSRRPGSPAVSATCCRSPTRASSSATPGRRRARGPSSSCAGGGCPRAVRSIVALEGSFHGRTLAALAATGTAGQARPLRAARGLGPVRAARRCRRARSRDGTRGRRADPRARDGGGRRASAQRRLPPGGAGALRPSAGRSWWRRDPVGHGALRRLARDLRGGRRARRRDARQGAGRRAADRRPGGAGLDLRSAPASTGAPSAAGRSCAPARWPCST